MQQRRGDGVNSHMVNMITVSYVDVERAPQAIAGLNNTLSSR